MGEHFDELSKAVAGGASRRRALKRFGAGVGAALLAGIVPGRKAAAQLTQEERQCREFCGEPEFGLVGPAYGQCVATCAACRVRGGTFAVLNQIPICQDF